MCGHSQISHGQEIQTWLTLVIALFLGMLTWLVQRQQAKTARLQYRATLFDRRMKVFNSVQEFILLVMRQSRVDSMDHLNGLLEQTRDKTFLFGPEVAKYIDDLHTHGVRLWRIHSSAGEAHVVQPDDIEENRREILWFAGGQLDIARKTFARYLDFTEP